MYVKVATKWLSFRLGWSDFAETGLYGFVITNGEKSRSTKAPNSAEFEELRNSEPWADSIGLIASLLKA